MSAVEANKENGTNSAMPPLTHKDAKARLARKSELVGEIRSAEGLMSMALQLPDKGARLKAKLALLRQELEALGTLDEERTVVDAAEREALAVQREQDAVALARREAQRAQIAEQIKQERADREACSGAQRSQSRPAAGSGIKVHSVTKLFEQLAVNVAELPERDVPAGLLAVALMRHQRQGLGWMMKKERSDSRCGILADDMGLGKSMQIVSLVCMDKVAEAEGRLKRRRQTLIVCPATLLGHWADEFERRVDPAGPAGRLRVVRHHGPGRKKGEHERALAKADVVVTTYSTVAQDVKAGDATSDACTGLFGIKWRRIVLDEAHDIKNASSKSARAVCRLGASCRWALTGTPVQNSLMDLFSIFRFLRFTFQGHNYTVKSTWDGLVKNHHLLAEGDRLRAVIHTAILRRTKAILAQPDAPAADSERAADEAQAAAPGSLPPKTMHLHEVELSAPERKMYETLAAGCQRAVAASDKQGHGRYATVLAILLRLRQACNHPRMLPPAIHAAFGLDVADTLSTDVAAVKEAFDDGDEALLDALAGLSLAAPDSPGRRRATPPPVDAQSDRPDSPAPATEPASGNAPSPPSKTPSSKLNAFLAALEAVDAGDKVVVFSQWTTMLDIVQDTLHDRGFVTGRLDGSLSQSRKEDALRRFRDEADVRVFLVSLKAGGVGLNLTSANHVFLIDMWWNPAIEEQAFDRVHRIGQTKPVSVHRFLVRNSVEERIRDLQVKKAALAKRALSRDWIDTDVGSWKGVTLKDLLDLFRDA